RRARRRRVTPRQTSNWKRDARPEVGELLRLRPGNLRQLAALHDVDAVGTLREDALPCAERPAFVPRIARELLRPAGDDVVRAEDVLASLFCRDRRDTGGRGLRGKG